MCIRDSKVADIYKSSMCPLAKVMRRELKKRGVKKLKVVYSEEKPTRPIEDMSISCRDVYKRQFVYCLYCFLKEI